MTDTELTTKLEDLRKQLSSHESAIITAKENAAYLKGQIKVFEKELERRKKWAEKTNAKQE